MLIKTKGILLHKCRFSDTSMIINVLTHDAGKQSFLVKGVYSKKSKNRISSLELLNLLEITAWKSSKSDLLTVRELDVWYHYQSISEDFNKKTIALFLAEFIHRTIQSPDADPQLYYFVENSLLFFDKMDKKYSDFHLRFLSHFTKYLGIIPQNDYSSQKPYFNILTASFYPIYGEDNYFFNDQSSFQLHKYLSTPLQDYLDYTFSLKERSVFLDDILRFYIYHLSHFHGLKSIRVLKSILH
ncbi:MAG: DNA repair protein RecO [Bacteroidales bacterium]|nr:DNA repair protein RecO [Bacteroidales bacterium]MDY0217340.1 DNA repair protein RecO [Bacteroidales bacterium]